MDSVEISLEARRTSHYEENKGVGLHGSYSQVPEGMITWVEIPGGIISAA